jgi:predicted DNA-binding transcriptional regulator YafY
MFSSDEIEALIVGSAWVARQKDDVRLSRAAANVVSKIGAVLPPELRDELDGTTLMVIGRPPPMSQIDPGLLRDAIRKELKLRIDYRDEAGRPSERVIWPFMIGFFEQHRVVGAWCELRQDFHHFRIDRIVAVAATGERSPRRRYALLKEWRALMDAQYGARTAPAPVEN